MRNSGLDKAVLVGMEEVADMRYVLEIKGMRLTDELDMGVKKKNQGKLLDLSLRQEWVVLPFTCQGRVRNETVLFGGVKVKTSFRH